MTSGRVAVLYAGMALLLAAAVVWSYRVTHSSADASAITPDRADLIPGIGKLHHPIVTASPEAQEFFDQGLTLVYAFEFDRAVRSFQRATELDPKAAMPYWGIALARGPNYNSAVPSAARERSAFDSIEIALEMEKEHPSSEQESAYINALAKRYAPGGSPDRSGLERNYSEAMREVHARSPDDPDAAALYAESLMDLHPWHLWSNTGQPSERTLEIVQVLESALRRWPDHVGANHFYIHALEGSPFPERALPSARLLGMLVPACSHLIHMPAHIYFRTGDYPAAVTSNLNAVAVDDDRSRHGQGSGYLHHDLSFLVAAAMMVGEFDTAYEGALRLASFSHSEASAIAPVLVLARFGRWDDVISAPSPEPTQPGACMFWRYARGCAFAAKKRSREAEEERRAMEREYRRITPGRAFGTFFNDWSALHTIAFESLGARIAAAQGDIQHAVERWRAAIATQDSMAFDDLPDWYYPVRESLGAVLLRNGQPADAEKVFREDLDRTARNPRSLFGLWKSLEAQKRYVDADWVRRSFESSWKGPALWIADL